jgi:hypothetical protein
MSKYTPEQLSYMAKEYLFYREQNDPRVNMFLTILSFQTGGLGIEQMETEIKKLIIEEKV